jgi:drug/metabolite transporter (DMT)-like permease
MVLGVLTSIPAPLLFAVDSPEAAFLLVLATSAVYLFLGGRIADRAVSGIAVVGAVIGVVGFLATAGVDDTSSGTVTLVVGALMLAAAIVFSRQVGGGGRASLGRPTLPLGVRVVPSEPIATTPPTLPEPPPSP